MSMTENQKADLKANIDFALGLLAEFKQKNIEEGLTGAQAMWLHHRMRAWPCTYQGVAYIEDIANMCVAGDLQTAYLALAYGTADDMSETYHWLSQARLDWLKYKIAVFLGWA